VTGFDAMQRGKPKPLAKNCAPRKGVPVSDWNRPKSKRPTRKLDEDALRLSDGTIGLGRPCFWCDVPLQPAQVTRDHLISGPLRKALTARRSKLVGRGLWRYTVACCSPCNLKRAKISGLYSLLLMGQIDNMTPKKRAKHAPLLGEMESLILSRINSPDLAEAMLLEIVELRGFFAGPKKMNRYVVTVRGPGDAEVAACPFPE
jgi:hypothetical protein